MDAPALDPPSGDPLLQRQQVQEELLRLEANKGSWGQTLFILLMSVLAFALVGLFNNPFQDLMLIIAILFLHEAGHYLGMKYYGYQNVRMFFIPFFGAAVSGRRWNIESWKHAVVALLGPLPGCFLSFLLILAFHFLEWPWTYRVAWLMLFINAFNLIPFMPLDGGHFLRIVLLSRRPFWDALFTVLTAGLICSLSFLFGFWLLGIVGLLILIAAPHGYRINLLAKKWRTDHGEASLGKSLLELDPSLYVTLEKEARERFSGLTRPRLLASVFHNTWEAAHTSPPNVVMSLALFTLYLTTCVLSVFAAFSLLAMPLPLKTQKLWDDHVRAGVSLIRSKHNKQAVDHLEKAVEIRRPFRPRDSDMAVNLYHLGQAEWRLGRREEAQKRWLEALMIARDGWSQEITVDLIRSIEFISQNKEQDIPKLWNDRYGD